MNLFLVTYFGGSRSCYVQAADFEDAVKTAKRGLASGGYTEKEREIEGVALIADPIEGTPLWEQRH